MTWRALSFTRALMFPRPFLGQTGDLPAWYLNDICCSAQALKPPVTSLVWEDTRMVNQWFIWNQSSTVW